MWTCTYGLERLNVSMLNTEVPRSSLAGNSLEYAGKVVSDSALLCLRRRCVQPKREEIREKLRSQVCISLPL